MRLPVPDRSPWNDFLTCARVSFGPSSGSSNGSSSQLMILKVAFVSIFLSLLELNGEYHTRASSPSTEKTEPPVRYALWGVRFLLSLDGRGLR